MPLELAPCFDDATREQIEQHVAQVQARRMVAAIEYHTGKDAKLSHESDKLEKRLQHKYEMLGKEILALEKAEGKVLDRLAELEHLKNELGLVNDMRELHQVPTEVEDE
jgi:hypothetical protein